MSAVENKVLMICAQEILVERNDGGKKCSYRTYELVRQVFGAENVILCMYSKKKGTASSRECMMLA